MTDTVQQGRLTVLPWVHLPHSVRIGSLVFTPVEIERIASVVGEDMAPSVATILRTHVDQRGQPITACTLVLKAGSKNRWDVSRRSWPTVHKASAALAMACLAEQEFMRGHFAAHLNATMFRPVSFAVSSQHDHMALSYPRRGGSLLAGGLRAADVKFQQPYQIEGTRCDVVNRRLASGLLKAFRSPSLPYLSEAIEIFLLGHAETPDLDSQTCVTLSAIAFEKLLNVESKGQTSLAVSEKLATLWSGFPSINMRDARRVKADPNKHASVQQDWPIRQKWVKELYETRSAFSHRGSLPDRSSNWKLWQHMVIAAFAFGHSLKLILEAKGFYQLTDTDKSDCGVFDRLLDSDWGSGDAKPPEWSSIISRERFSNKFDTDWKEFLGRSQHQQ